MNMFKIIIGLCFIFGLFLVQTKSENEFKDDSRLARLLHTWYNANLKKILSAGSNGKKRDLAEVFARDWKLKNGEKESPFYRFLSLYGR